MRNPADEGLRREAWRAFSSRDFRTAHRLCLQWLAGTPGASDPVFLMGMIAAEMGNVSRALELMSQAIAIDGSEPAWHAQVARLEILRHDPQAAVHAARRGMALQPRDALTLSTLGMALMRAGANEESIEPLRLAVTLAPRRPDIAFNLAAAEQLAGHFEEAARAYRQVLQQDPGSYKALSALSAVASRGLTAAEVSAAESALSQGGLSPDDEWHLCHALASMHERAGNPALAMQMLARGKQRKRASMQRDPREEEQLFTAVQRTCDAAFCQATATGFETTEPLFIVGMPRSGITLLERMLASHPAVTSTGELMQFPMALKQVAGAARARLLDVPMIEAARRCDLREVGRRYLDSTRPRTGATPHFTDRMPLNFFYAGFIHRALPRARILCLRRGAADTCLANYRQISGTGLPYYAYSLDLADTARFVAGFDRLATHWAGVLGDAWLDVRYEDLVADLEGQARRVLAFCGLRWDPACVDLHPRMPQRAGATPAPPGNALPDSSIGRWRQYRPMIDVAVAELQRQGMRPE